MSDVASEEPQSLTDEAILARFANAKRRPPGSELLGFRMVRVSQADREEIAKVSGGHSVKQIAAALIKATDPDEIKGRALPPGAPTYSEPTPAERRLRSHVAFLADDLLEGRAAGIYGRAAEKPLVDGDAHDLAVLQSTDSPSPLLSTARHDR